MLSQAKLGALGDKVAMPEYDRTAVRPGIVHFGVGGFHRAHQAMYVDRLMNDGKALDWGICGVGTMPGRTAVRSYSGMATLSPRAPSLAWLSIWVT